MKTAHSDLKELLMKHGASEEGARAFLLGARMAVSSTYPSDEDLVMNAVQELIANAKDMSVLGISQPVTGEASFALPQKMLRLYGDPSTVDCPTCGALADEACTFAEQDAPWIYHARRWRKVKK